MIRPETPEMLTQVHHNRILRYRSPIVKPVEGRVWWNIVGRGDVVKALLHRIAPAAQTGAHRPVIAVRPLLVLCLGLRLRLLLLLLPRRTPPRAHRAPDYGACSGASAGIAPDGANRGACSGAPGATAHHLTPSCALLWRSHRRWIRWIEARLLHGPVVAFEAILGLLLFTLSLLRIDTELTLG